MAKLSRNLGRPSWCLLLACACWPGGSGATPAPQVSVGNCTVDPLALQDGCPPFPVLNQDDPGQRILSAYPSGAPVGTVYFLLQRTTPVDQEWLDDVQDPTVNILSLLPEQGLLLRVLPGGMAHLADVATQHPGETRALWRCREAYKPVWSVAGALDPTYGSFDNHVDATGMLRLRALLHRGEDPSWYLDALRLGLPPGSVVEAITSGAPLGIAPNAYIDCWIPTNPPEAPGQALHVLSATDAISFINTWDSPEDALNEVTWSTQTNVDRETVPDGYDTAAKLFARGVTGRGQVVTMLDRGFLPHIRGLCGLRYGPNDSDAPPVPADILQPPLAWSGLPNQYYTPQNKVIAHYLIQSTSPEALCQPWPTYTAYAAHGRNTTAVAVADNFGVPAARAGVVMDDPTDDELGQDPQAAIVSIPPGTRDVATRLVDHHQDRDGVAPGAQVVIQDFNPPNPEEHSPSAPPIVYLECHFDFLDVLWQAHETHSEARVHNNSWGVRTNLDGYPVDLQYHDTCVDYDVMAWSQRDFLSVFSAGNEPALYAAPSSLRREANLKNGLAVNMVGASEIYSGNAGSGSHGPGYWRRMKPDLTGLNAAFEMPSCSESWRLSACENVSSCCVNASYHCLGTNGQAQGGGGAAGNGTSISAPIVSGMAALMRQYFEDGYYPGGTAGSSPGFVPTNALLKAALINACRNLSGPNSGDTYGESAPEARPTFGQGWGGPVLDDTLFFAGDPTPGAVLNAEERSGLLILTDTPNGLADVATLNHRRVDAVDAMHAAIASGQVHEYRVWVADAAESAQQDGFHVTLAWADPPGSVMDANPPVTPSNGDPWPPLVNDLDLEVVDPAGVVWRSNPGEGEHAEFRLWRDGHSTARPMQRLPPRADCSASCGSTCPSGSTEDAHEQSDPATCDFQTRDRMNNVENVIIAPADLIAGYYRVRVIGWRVLGNGYGGVFARPNWDDTDGSLDHDFINDNRQGYALVATGKIATDRGAVHFDHSYYKCGEQAFVQLNDADALSGATVRVWSGDAVAPLDCEILNLGGSAPFLQTAVPLTIMDVADPLAPASMNACQVSATPVLVTSDDSDIHVEYLDSTTPAPPYPDPAYAPATAAAHVTCRNVSLSDFPDAVEVKDAPGFGCATMAANNALSRGEQAVLVVHVRNTTGHAITGLVGTLIPFDEDVHVTVPTFVFPPMPALDPDEAASFDLYLDDDHACAPEDPLRFRFELTGDDGFKDRIYFDAPQDCAGHGGPPEVPDGTGVGGAAEALRVKKAATVIDLVVSWNPALDPPTGNELATAYNVWRGDLRALHSGYSHAIDPSSTTPVGACNVPATAASRYAQFLLGDASYSGPGHDWYYLVSGEVPCVLAPGGELHGPVGWADRNANGVHDPDDLIPLGAYLSPGCN